jgi:hypothetical protein
MIYPSGLQADGHLSSAGVAWLAGDDAPGVNNELATREHEAKCLECKHSVDMHQGATIPRLGLPPQADSALLRFVFPEHYAAG